MTFEQMRQIADAYNKRLNRTPFLLEMTWDKVNSGSVGMFLYIYLN